MSGLPDRSGPQDETAVRTRRLGRWRGLAEAKEREAALGPMIVTWLLLPLGLWTVNRSRNSQNSERGSDIEARRRWAPRGPPFVSRSRPLHQSPDFPIALLRMGSRIWKSRELGCSLLVHLVLSPNPLPLPASGFPRRPASPNSPFRPLTARASAVAQSRPVTLALEPQGSSSLGAQSRLCPGDQVPRCPAEGSTVGAAPGRER